MQCLIVAKARVIVRSQLKYQVKGSGLELFTIQARTLYEALIGD